MWSQLKAKNLLVAIVRGMNVQKIFKGYITCRILCSKAVGSETGHLEQGSSQS